MLGALLLAFLAYGLVGRESTLRPFRWQAFFSLSLHQVAIFTNVHITRLPGNLSDARRFYHDAVAGFHPTELVGTGAAFYRNGLALLVKLLGPSEDVVYQSSLVGFALVLVAVARLLKELDLEKSTGLVVVLIGLSPSTLCYTSATIREVWQQLFLIGSCLGLVQYQKHPSQLALVKVVVALLFLGCLQKGLALYALLFAAGSFLFLGGVGSGRKPLILFLIILSLIVSYVTVLGGGNWEPSSAVVEAATEGELLDYALKYRTGLDEARANYGEHLELDSPGRFLLAFPQLLFYFWFAPLPWQIEEMQDAISCLEIWVRLGLIVVGLQALTNQEPRRRRTLIFLWLAFLLLECMWAAATSNWGTAARHRTVGLPLLCVLGVAGLKTQPPSEPQPTQKRTPLSTREKIRRRRARLRKDD